MSNLFVEGVLCKSLIDRYLVTDGGKRYDIHLSVWEKTGIDSPVFQYETEQVVSDDGLTWKAVARDDINMYEFFTTERFMGEIKEEIDFIVALTRVETQIDG